MVSVYNFRIICKEGEIKIYVSVFWSFKKMLVIENFSSRNKNSK